MTDTTDGIHVVAKDDRWVTISGDKVLSRHFTKGTAIATGRAKAKAHGQQFTVHRADGTVISTRTYGTSPV
jgi:hypothetical protein